MDSEFSIVYLLSVLNTLFSLGVQVSQLHNELYLCKISLLSFCSIFILLRNRIATLHFCTFDAVCIWVINEKTYYKYHY